MFSVISLHSRHMDNRLMEVLDEQMTPLIHPNVLGFYREIVLPPCLFKWNACFVIFSSFLPFFSVISVSHTILFASNAGVLCNIVIVTSLFATAVVTSPLYWQI